MAGKSKKKSFKNIAKNVLGQIPNDNVAIVAAGVAFYLYLALFPALTALIALYGLLTDPDQVSQQISQLSSILPEQADDFIQVKLSSLASRPRQSLTIGAVVSILLGIWAANNGTRAMFKGVILAYNEDHSRAFLKSTGLTLLFTVSGIIVVLISIILIVGFPVFINKLDLPDTLQILLKWGRWLVLGLIAYLSITFVYRFAPLRKNPKFRWINWGAGIATLLWLLGSGGFSLFVNLFGSLDKIFGSVGAIIILMLWFLLSSFCILMGAEINAELEN